MPAGVKINAQSVGVLLAERFGKDAVRVKTPYHLQVSTARGVWHNVYVSGRGLIKLQAKGNAKVSRLRNLEHLEEKLSKAATAKSDVAAAQEAVDLTVLISASQRSMPRAVDEAVFVDAGWRDGIAQVGFVRLKRVDHGFDTSAASWPVRTENPSEAERLAIEYGADFAPLAVVYSDCKPLVDELSERYEGRLRWLPRQKNRAADRIANRRG